MHRQRLHQQPRSDCLKGNRRFQGFCITCRRRGRDRSRDAVADPSPGASHQDAGFEWALMHAVLCSTFAWSSVPLEFLGACLSKGSENHSTLANPLTTDIGKCPECRPRRATAACWSKADSSKPLQDRLRVYALAHLLFRCEEPTRRDGDFNVLSNPRKRNP